jgi:two-component system response regulator AtoC
MNQEGQFCKGLCYLLNVIDIQLLPLRERKEDIPLPIQRFIKIFGEEMKKNISGISEDALKCY